ncbi:helix-turn-helix transcriptional regulator [Metabacillus dongyingensis]|uniref:helix-turn-helix domain-containing protein n=1 Tax=Metabacillus dongyingensis TaxID=2874282 RepID=UPI003B8D0410
MNVRAKSELKKILDERKISIRQFAADTKIPFETIRRLYNDTTVRYERNTLGTVCRALNIEIQDLLILVEEETKEPTES